MDQPIRKIAPGVWGEWAVDSNGYVKRNRTINGKNERQYLHRLVMEEALDRKLLGSENIHHINGVRHDNRIENLELWSTWQPAGQRLVDKIEWARNILFLYEGVKLAP